MSKTKKVVIESGEDKGKVFVISRMPAVKGDRFMMRLLHGLAKGGINVGETKEAIGLLGINQLTVSLIGSLSEELFLELMDEILQYVKYVPKGGEARPLDLDVDIEDMFTLSTLRMKFVEAQTDFLTPGETQN